MLSSKHRIWKYSKKKLRNLYMWVSQLDLINIFFQKLYVLFPLYCYLHFSITELWNSLFSCVHSFKLCNFRIIQAFIVLKKLLHEGSEILNDHSLESVLSSSLVIYFTSNGTKLWDTFSLDLGMPLDLQHSTGILWKPRKNYKFEAGFWSNMRQTNERDKGTDKNK